MFDPKEKKVKVERQYLDILPKFRDIIIGDMKACLNDQTAPFFKKLQGLEYDLLKDNKENVKRAECLRTIAYYELGGRMERVVDKALAMTVQDARELDTLLKGLTTSLRLTEREQEAVIKLFKSNPSLLYCRIIELTR